MLVRCAAFNEDYPFPFVEGIEPLATSQLGEAVTLTGRHFSRDTKVCVGDIDVSGPPVWRVSAKYKNATSGIEKHSEIEVAEAHPLASAAIRHCDWAQPCHLCGETGRILRRSAPGFGSPLPHFCSF
jgi:hypothetical protein